MRKRILRYNALAIFILAIILCSCHQKENDDEASVKKTNMDAGVRKMASDIARDIEAKGSVAWLDYFDQSPYFFMANDGKIVFPNNDSATHFIKNVLVKNITKVRLQWTEMKVDSLAPGLAFLNAAYHEQLFDTCNKAMPADGYFTGLAAQTNSGWKLRNLHWSSLKQ